MGLLFYLLTLDEEKKKEFELNEDSTVRDTDPNHYLDVVWKEKNSNM